MKSITPSHRVQKSDNEMFVLWGIRVIWLGYFIVLFIATHSPIPESVAGMTSGWDKPVHFCAYFVLALLTVGAFATFRPVRFPVLVILPSLIIYGAMDEVIQGYVGRHPDVIDWASDCLGIIAGLALASVIASLINSGAYRLPMVWRRQSTDPTA